jgi:hypothetical protein
MALLTVPEIVQLFPVFKGKLGYRVANMLRKHLSVDKVSDVEDRNCMFRGADFADACLDDLRIDVQVGNPERLASLPEGPFITISNHPYGGVDGIILIDLIGHLRSEFKVIVNEFLSHIESLHPSMIFVNPKIDDNSVITPTNLQGIREIMRHLRNGSPVGIFPSGAVSDLHPHERRIYDREWQPSILRIIQRAKVPVVPIRFFDRNSLFFYLLGLISWKIRVLRLPTEIINKVGTSHRIGIGKTISVKEQSLHQDLKSFGKFLRDSVYGMPLPETFRSRKEIIR